MDVPILRVSRFGRSAALLRFRSDTCFLLLQTRHALTLAAQWRAPAVACDAPNIALKPETVALGELKVASERASRPVAATHDSLAKATWAPRGRLHPTGSESSGFGGDTQGL